MKTEVSEAEQIEEKYSFICAALPSDYFIDFICLYPYGGS